MQRQAFRWWYEPQMPKYLPYSSLAPWITSCLFPENSSTSEVPMFSIFLDGISETRILPLYKKG
ncbi:hypothetical protein DU52_04980 [Methanosarcina mazei]|uniref:Uncharacterized protein n=1 Tax=Methanosarcina mazei TaxID=2209 RepID=A0A0F8GEV2_METMZ|nr:hypothetical protein DU52_04980 [Methanosarcina mazei]KKG33892.1 hypothetical protein DU30_02315 [Methanosarcina mazei]KKG63807.1 hypothetical protein DU67_01615 [Methanosarcina mazei]KKH28846.1 hypothetical protein DU58_19325 [Methanosarcina mazei]KKH57782.1 hypothetical protein DU74_18215 [Methanosarcina mazei]